MPSNVLTHSKQCKGMSCPTFFLGVVLVNSNKRWKSMFPQMYFVDSFYVYKAATIGTILRLKYMGIANMYISTSSSGRSSHLCGSSTPSVFGYKMRDIHYYFSQRPLVRWILPNAYHSYAEILVSSSHVYTMLVVWGWMHPVMICIPAYHMYSS